MALGIDLSGQKDILGLWISENEGAKFWLNNLTEMKNRGMSDMLIACTDNLTGMSEAISAVYPKCEHQLCIVHQIRNSLKYVSYKDRKELVADLKPIYQASTEDVAHTALESLNSQLRRVTKNKRVFPSDELVFKTLYLTINYITAKWTMPIQNLGEAMAHFLIKFEDRIHNNI